jgi:hypothetical protein
MVTGTGAKMVKGFLLKRKGKGNRKLLKQLSLKLPDSPELSF